MSPPSSSSPARHLRKLVKKAAKHIMKSQRLALPKYDLPIRLRPWFVLFTLAIMLLFALFGLTDVARSLPLNNKLVHLACFGVATGVFYFIFDVDEEARRVWFWRHANLIFTALVCFFFGGLVSEIVQSMLPHKHFDVGDAVANIIGSTIGLYTSYHIERHYRSRREIARLYRPLDTDDPLGREDYSDEEASPSGMQLLPLFHPPNSTKSSLPPKAKSHKHDRLADVWDEHEELFGIGDDSDSDLPAAPSHANGSRQAGPLPTIVVTRP